MQDTMNLNEEDIDLIIKQDVDLMVSEMIREFEKYMNEGSESLSSRQRIIVIGRVVNVSHHAYMLLIKRMVKAQESKLGQLKGSK